MGKEELVGGKWNRVQTFAPVCIQIEPVPWLLCAVQLPLSSSLKAAITELAQRRRKITWRYGMASIERMIQSALLPERDTTDREYHRDILIHGWYGDG